MKTLVSSFPSTKDTGLTPSLYFSYNSKKGMRISGLFFALMAASHVLLVSAETMPGVRLATRGAPPCPAKPGVRVGRSALVQFAGVSASISAQSMREDDGACVQSAALWVTKDAVSRQFELTGAADATFSLVDLSPDSSSVLLYKDKAAAAPANVPDTEIALLSFNQAAIQWLPVPQFLGWKACDGPAQPRGFLGDGRLVFAVAPPTSPGKTPRACVSQSKLIAFDPITRKSLDVPAATSVSRNARIAAGPVLSCSGDPDLSGACYRMRGRVAFADGASSMRVWQVGTNRVVDLADGMLPDDLASQVTSTVRVYANMLVCPIHRAGVRSAVCIESAENYHPEPISPRPPVKQAGTIVNVTVPDGPR